LADIVGSAVRVIGLERSGRFLDALRTARDARHVDNIETYEIDLDEDAFPIRNADGAWCRWVLCFVRKPREVLAKIGGCLRMGGSLVLHEYFDYSTWRLAPRCPELEDFVGVVMKSWRDQGGEPDIALDLTHWLAELGFAIREMRPIVDVVPAHNYIWHWPASFVTVGLRRLVDLGHFTPERAAAITAAFDAAESAPHTHMITPAVLEIIAERRA
jgi:SAM-dependent methyltransferase